MSVNAVQIPIQICELCSGNHATQECQVGNSFAQSEQINYMNNLQRGQRNFYSNPHQNADNQDRRNQLQNLSWSSNYNDTKHPSQHHEYPEKKLNIEDMFSKIMDKIDKTTEQVEKRFEVNELKIQNHDATLKILELQVGQIYGMLSQRLQGAFPSDTEKNPRAQANAVTLRSGTKYDGPKLKEPEIEVEAEEVVRKDKNVVDKVDHEDEVDCERRKKEDEAMKRRMEEHARNEPLVA